MFPALLLAAALSSAFAGQEPEHTAIAHNTFGDVQLAASPELGRVKLTTVSAIGPNRHFGACDCHWLGVSVFAQSGIDVHWSDDQSISGWTAGRAGIHWSWEGKSLTVRQNLNIGVIAFFPGTGVQPQIGYSALLSAAGGRVSALTIHSLGFSEDRPVSYYYEGYAAAGPWKKGPQLGVFWENTYGPRVGPRISIGGFYAHVNLLDTPIVYAGYQFRL